MTATAASTDFQPYGFLSRGRTSPSRTSTPTIDARANASPASTRCTPEPFSSTFTETLHAKHLGERLEFVALPNIAMIEGTELPASSRCLFFGHLRFETTTAEVRWLIKKLTDVTPLRADIRGNGCCVVYLATDQDVAAVRNLNRRVLFDRHGFWFANDNESVDYLMDYVEKVLPKLGSGAGGCKRRALRMPRDALVVEDSRSSKHSRRKVPAPTPSSLHDTPRHQPQQPVTKTAPGSDRLSACSASKYPTSPFSLGASSSHPVTPMMSSINFHDNPPDYVNPPSMSPMMGAPPEYGASFEAY